jgi:hypothetical protein
MAASLTGADLPLRSARMLRTTPGPAIADFLEKAKQKAREDRRGRRLNSKVTSARIGRAGF